eukprot:TRINITY_DN17786_c0_g1_i1.p1 TRINITY_DN17786_c0_g1~~TRINITY_DN17786_c0_g1_i1.p1  ORF type:complete len:746 (-),score=152.42 TRINITY_DN17786_c0_g1_i1:298-2535(-)
MPPPRGKGRIGLAPTQQAPPSKKVAGQGMDAPSAVQPAAPVRPARSLGRAMSQKESHPTFPAGPTPSTGGGRLKPGHINDSSVSPPPNHRRDPDERIGKSAVGTPQQQGSPQGQIKPRSPMQVHWEGKVDNYGDGLRPMLRGAYGGADSGGGASPASPQMTRAPSTGAMQPAEARGRAPGGKGQRKGGGSISVGNLAEAGAQQGYATLGGGDPNSARGALLGGDAAAGVNRPASAARDGRKMDMALAAHVDPAQRRGHPYLKATPRSGPQHMQQRKTKNLDMRDSMHATMVRAGSAGIPSPRVQTIQEHSKEQMPWSRASTRDASPMPSTRGSLQRKDKAAPEAKPPPFGTDKIVDFSIDPAKKFGAFYTAGNSHGVPGMECKCPVCKPFAVKPAGQLSSLVASNRSTTNLNAVSDPREQVNLASEAFQWSVRTEDYTHHRDSGAQQKDARLTEDIHKELGRKKRVSKVPMRSTSMDPTWESCAGFRGLQKERGIRHRKLADDSDGNIVPGLTPDCLRIAHLPAEQRLDHSAGIGNPDEKWAKKGKGEFSAGFSSHTHRLSVANHANELRYEGVVTMGRSASVPPELSRARWNPVTHEGDQEAGVLHSQALHFGGSQASCDQGSFARSPSANSAGGESTGVFSGAAGIPMSRIADKKYKQWRGSPRRRDTYAYNSHLMSSLTTNDGFHQAAEDRRRRLETDKTFANLCSMVEEVSQERENARLRIQQANGSNRSHQVAFTLAWDS